MAHADLSVTQVISYLRLSWQDCLLGTSLYSLPELWTPLNWLDKAWSSVAEGWRYIQGSSLWHVHEYMHRKLGWRPEIKQLFPRALLPQSNLTPWQWGHRIQFEGLKSGPAWGINPRTRGPWHIHGTQDAPSTPTIFWHNQRLYTSRNPSSALGQNYPNRDLCEGLVHNHH